MNRLDFNQEADNFNLRIKKIHSLLKNSGNIVIISHPNPDGDSVGSSIALYHYAIQIGVKADIIFPDDLPKNLLFLNGVNEIKLYNESLHKKIILNKSAIFILDLNDISRLNSLKNAIEESSALKIVIDHHLEPKEFADHYLVDTEASSTGELIWKIISSDKNLIITQTIAEALYTSIMTDSGNFRFPRTDSELFRIAAQLVDAGADPVKIYDEIYNKVSFNGVRLLGEGYSAMERFYGGRLCVMALTKENFDKTGAIEDDIENFVESLLFIEGVKVGILIVEIIERNEVRISFRSKGEFYVRSLAMKFNGGGHHYAAGARVHNEPVLVVRQKIIDEAKYLFEDS